MANQFQFTSDFVQEAADAAATILQANTVAYQLTSHQVEERFNTMKTGGKVRVKYVPSENATSRSHRNSSKGVAISDANEESVEVDAYQHISVKKQLDMREKTFELENFTRVYTAPAMIAIAEALDKLVLRRLAGGALVAGRITGTPGTAPTTVAHIINARKKLEDRKVPKAGRVAVLGTTTEAALLQLDNFANSDYGADGPTRIREAQLARRYALDFYIDQNVTTFPQGDTAGTPLMQGAASGGETSVIIDGFSDVSGNGLIHEGAQFTAVGDATVYTVTEDAEINTSGEATVKITPAVVTGWSDNAVVTFGTAPTMDMLWHPGMVAAAAIAPSPLMEQSTVGTFQGISVRMSFESNTGTTTTAPADFVLYDIYAGARVIRDEAIEIVQG